MSVLKACIHYLDGQNNIWNDEWIKFLHSDTT